MFGGWDRGAAAGSAKRETGSPHLSYARIARAE